MGIQNALNHKFTLQGAPRISAATIEEEVSESLMNSKALCLSENQASFDDGMILKDLSRSYHEASELEQS